MKRVGGDDAAVEREQFQDLQRASRLVASGRLLLRHRQASLHRKHVDQMQWSCPPTALVGAAQSLAIDRHHAGELEAIGLGKRRHEAAEHALEGCRIEQPEHPAESVVAGNPMFQTQKQPQQRFLGLPKIRHVGAGFGATQHRRQGNDENVQQIVSGVVRPRVRQRSKSLLELAHPTPSTFGESSSESFSQNNAIHASKPYAIPLPHAGRGRVT
jgi:hypothetical protein